MSALWAEIVETWDLFFEGKYFVGDASTLENTTMIPPKLAIYSGHDTTIMPLLASISPDLWDDTNWAPYASMMLIEVSSCTKRSCPS